MPDLSQNISRRYGYYNGQETNGINGTFVEYKRHCS
jgi:alpha-galactosidase/6-phospho-beta-glucosidase family protein